MSRSTQAGESCAASIPEKGPEGSGCVEEAARSDLVSLESEYLGVLPLEEGESTPDAWYRVYGTRVHYL